MTVEAKALWELMKQRRTKRFGKGFSMPSGGPLGYASSEKGPSLDPAHEAYLALAAVGITGAALGDLPYQSGSDGGGNIMSRFVSRAAITPDAAHTVGLFVVNDSSVRFVKRPQNLSAGEMKYLNSDDVVKLYESISVDITGVYSDERGYRKPGLSGELPDVPNFNRWATNKQGSTYFVPVMELSELYLCALFGGLSESAGYYVLDERNGMQPTGLATFAKSEGGWLEDGMKGRVFPLGVLDTMVAMFASVELGAVLQNMSLMAQAIGVGGWPHYAFGTAWLRALKFRSRTLKSSQILGLDPNLSAALKLTNNDQDEWSPLGFEYPYGPIDIAVQNETADTLALVNDPERRYLIKPYCPPYYASMEDAVRAFAKQKFEATGRLRPGGGPSPWIREADVKDKIAEYTPNEVEAAVEHAEYVYDRYGRFPAKFGPVVTLNAFQAHNLDRQFYEKYYVDDILGYVTPAAHGESSSG